MSGSRQLKRARLDRAEEHLADQAAADRPELPAAVAQRLGLLQHVVPERRVLHAEVASPPGRAPAPDPRAMAPSAAMRRAMAWPEGSSQAWPAEQVALGERGWLVGCGTLQPHQRRRHPPADRPAALRHLEADLEEVAEVDLGAQRPRADHAADRLALHPVVEAVAVAQLDVAVAEGRGDELERQEGRLALGADMKPAALLDRARAAPRRRGGAGNRAARAAGNGRRGCGAPRRSRGRRRPDGCAP